jgi:hypothetical protein
MKSVRLPLFLACVKLRRRIELRLLAGMLDRQISRPVVCTAVAVNFVKSSVLRCNSTMNLNLFVVRVTHRKRETETNVLARRMAWTRRNRLAGLNSILFFFMLYEIRFNMLIDQVTISYIRISGR